MEDLNVLLKEIVRQGLPGCACQVRHKGEIIFEGYAGYADIKNKTAFCSDTIYRIFSLTKIYTCVAVLKLASEGRLSITDPVSKYLPEYESLHTWKNGCLQTSGVPLRIWNLLTMTAGIPYNGTNGGPCALSLQNIIEELNIQYPGESYTTREFARRLAGAPLEFEPGHGWVYGLSHDILGALIEKVSGLRFEEYLKQAIWEPLNLKNTSFKLSGSMQNHLAVLYQRDKSLGHVPDASRDISYQRNARFESGGGGLLSSLNDFAVFADALCYNRYTGSQKRLIDGHLYEQMIHNQLDTALLSNFPYQGFGYGFGVRVSLANPREFGWYGVSGSWCVINPAKELVIVYMQQAIPGHEEQILPYIRDYVYRCLTDR